jgi:hypothetical protein
MNNIEPYPYITTVTVTGFTLEIVNFVPNTSVRVRVVQYAGDKVVKTMDFVTLEGQAYSDWGNDDNYLIQYVATQMGFVLTP